MPSKEATPPPVIGKAGRYTVFITPPASPKPKPLESSRSQNHSPRPTPSGGSRFSNSISSSRFEDLKPVKNSPLKVASPPVAVPPPQFDDVKGGKGSSSMFGAFWNAVAKVQDAHSSLDRYLADLLGLDQSKYQWALRDYYEHNGVDKDCDKSKGVNS